MPAPQRGLEETPHPASSLSHLLPREKERDFCARSRAPNDVFPSPRGEGGGHAPPGEGSLSTLANTALPELSNCCCLPGRAGGSPNGLVRQNLLQRTRGAAVVMQETLLLLPGHVPIRSLPWRL